MTEATLGRRLGAVSLGHMLAGGLALSDALSSPNDVFISTVVLALFVVSVAGGPRETALVAAVAAGLTGVSGMWNHNFQEGSYYLRGATCDHVPACDGAIGSPRKDTPARDRRAVSGSDRSGVPSPARGEERVAGEPWTDICLRARAGIHGGQLS